MSFAAFSISAVSSTTTGGFPAPAPIAFLPDERTVFTIPGPPVATRSLIFGCFIISFVASIDGSLTIVIRLSGAPLSTNALFNICIRVIDVFFARGCGENTTEFPPTIIDIEFDIIVSVGLVVGVMDPITPKGQNSSSISPLEPVSAFVFKSSFPGVLVAATLFFIILSLTLPISVSSTAILEIKFKFSSFNTVSRITSANLSRSSIERL